MNLRAACVALLVAGCVAGLAHHRFAISLWWALLPLLACVAVLIYGVSTIQSGMFTKVHCSGDPSLKEIAITFDDGPNAEFTPKVLSALAEFDAPAAFFVIGRNIQGNEDLLRRMDAAGHVVGNHSFTHSYFIDFKSPEGFREELDRTADAVYKVLGKRIKLFRPPYGVTTPNLAEASQALDYALIGWNIRSFDTNPGGEESIAKRVLGQIKPGAVILFHDASDKTVAVLKHTLRFARRNGFTVVSLERLLKLAAYA